MRTEQEKTYEHVKGVAKQYNLKSVFVFGSYARNEQTENSDLDIVVDTENSSVTSLFSLGSLYSDIKDGLDCDVDIMTMKSLNEYGKDIESEIIFGNIKRDMVKIYERA